MGDDKNKGDMSVSEAGQKGGERVRKLVEEGKQQKGSDSQAQSESEEMEELGE